MQEAIGSNPIFSTIEILSLAFYDILVRRKKVKVIKQVQLQVYSCLFLFLGMSNGIKVTKGVRWMPRLLQAMKDVISCDKPWLGANNL